MKRTAIDWAWELFADARIGGAASPRESEPLDLAARVIRAAQADAVRPWRRCAWACIAAAAAVLAAAFGGLV